MRFEFNLSIVAQQILNSGLVIVYQLIPLSFKIRCSFYPISAYPLTNILTFTFTPGAVFLANGPSLDKCGH